MRVTIAICTWNRCELLRQTLEQLTRLAVPPGLTWNVVVVNNSCTDETDAVIGEWSSRLPLRRVFEGRPGLAHARNAALAATAGDYVIFIDDDVLVDRSWLVEFAAAATAFPEVAAIGGVIEPWFAADPDPALGEAFPRLSSGFCGLDHEREPGPLTDDLYIWGANMAFRSASIQSLRFDPTFGPRAATIICGDDTDFLRRLRASGGVVLWWPTMKVRHYVEPSRMTLDYLLRHQVGDGTARALAAPERHVASIGGVPRWVLRRYVEVSIEYCLSLLPRGDRSPLIEPLSGPPPSATATCRVRAMTWRREMAFLRGMARGYRQRSR